MHFLLLTNRKKKRERNQMSLLLLSSKMLKLGNRNTYKMKNWMSVRVVICGLSNVLKNGNNSRCVCVCVVSDPPYPI